MTSRLRTPQDELLKNRCPPKTVDVWRKGVDTGMFHPRHRSQAMRERLSGGFPSAPILVYVGRLGAGACAQGLLSRLWPSSSEVPTSELCSGAKLLHADGKGHGCMLRACALDSALMN